MVNQYTALPMPERYWAKVDKDGPIPDQRPDLGKCWLWMGAIQRLGYGSFYLKGTTTILAHHFIVGKPMEGLEWDHLCRIRRCVNPSHLELVTRQVNVLRSLAPSALHARKVHCPAGHPYNLLNTFYSRGRRGCRECRRARQRASYRITQRLGPIDSEFSQRAAFEAAGLPYPATVGA